MEFCPCYATIGPPNPDWVEDKEAEEIEEVFTKAKSIEVDFDVFNESFIIDLM